MIRSHQLREYIIRPVLEGLGLWSQDAEDLLLGTAAAESRLGTYIHQVGGGPALGIYQMEPTTHDDIWDNYLAYRPDLASAVRGHARQRLSQPLSEDLIGNLWYATAMARIHYLRVPRPIPNNLEGQAEYWKKYYNTYQGAGTTQHFKQAYEELVL